MLSPCWHYSWRHFRYGTLRVWRHIFLPIHRKVRRSHVKIGTVTTDKSRTSFWMTPVELGYHDNVHYLSAGHSQTHNIELALGILTTRWTSTYLTAKAECDITTIQCILLRNTVVQLVEAQRYKPEGRGFFSRWCPWHNPSDRIMAFGLTQPLKQMSITNTSWGVKAAGL